MIISPSLIPVLDDDICFDLIRTYLAEVISPKAKTVPPQHIHEVFDDDRLRLVREVGRRSYDSWLYSAVLYSNANCQRDYKKAA